MRQAIIVKNPKWEPFTAVSDAFKALTVKDKESAVLVVRGRCKEKNIKTMKPLTSGKTAEWLKTQSKEVVEKVKKTAALVIGLCLFAVAANAQQDITTLVGVATTNPGMSNSAVLTSPPLSAQPGDLIVVQATHTGLIGATGTSNIVYSCDQQLAGNYWHTNAFTMTFPCVSSNGNTAILKFTNTLGAIRFRFGNVTRGEANPFRLTEMQYYLARP